MNTLADLVEPSIDAFFSRIDEWLFKRRLIAIQREKEVLEKQIENDLEAIADLDKEAINLRNQFFLPKGMHL